MSDAAAWAQAWLSGAAILASGVFAVWVPRHERRVAREASDRQRLSVETERFPPAGLYVTFRYRPEFWHVGLTCRVTLLEPKDAQFIGMRLALNSGQMTDGSHVLMEPDGPFIGGVSPVKLIRDGRETVFGSLRLLPPLHDTNAILPKARLRFEIVTDAGDTLYETEMLVSPIERVPTFVVQADPTQAPGGGIYGIDNVARV